MWKQISAVIGCAGVLSIAGCGGGATTAQPTQDTGAKITKANQARFSQDAIVLAERASDGPLLSADKAAMFDSDLALIRTQFPQVANIHTVGDYAQSQLLIGLTATAGWTPLWNQGVVQTGNTNVDSVLSAYGASSVQPLASGYVVTFDRPLNLPALIPILRATSSDFRYVQVNGPIGDGDRINFDQTGGQKKYILSHGFGDCPSGCINRHVWTFTFAGGSIQLQESGPALPANGG